MQEFISEGYPWDLSLGFIPGMTWVISTSFPSGGSSNGRSCLMRQNWSKPRQLYELVSFTDVVKFDYILEDKPMPVANYLEAGSELKIKVDLAYPLNATEEAKKTDESIDEEMVRRKREKTRWKLFH